VPKGAFNLVMGKGSAIGEPLVANPDVDGVSFTGSVSVGASIARTCAGRLSKVQLEMGGKNPLVVLDDADLGTAVGAAINGAYFSTGQRCTASSRFIVTAGIHDRFVAAMAAKMKSLKGGRRARPRHRHRPGGWTRRSWRKTSPISRSGKRRAPGSSAAATG